MAKRWTGVLGYLERHVWADGKIKISAVQTIHTVTRYRIYTIQAEAMGLFPGGWLESAVDFAPNPIAANIANSVSRFIDVLAEDAECRLLLRTPLRELRLTDVLTMYKAIDGIAESMSIRSRNDHAQQVRRFLSPELKIATGDLLRDINFESDVPEAAPRPRDTLSDRPHPGLADSDLAKPAATLAFSSLEELREKQITHFEGRNRILIDTCTKILDSHEAAVKAIREARKQDIGQLDLPSSLRKHIIEKKKIPPHKTGLIYEQAMLPVCVYLMDAHHLYKTQKKVTFPNRPIIEFRDLTYLGGFYEQSAILMSEHYLTRYVLMACLTLLMLETSWNSSTMLSLSKDRIQENDGRYYLHGYKSKTDQNQSAEAPAINDEVSQSDTQATASPGLLSNLENDGMEYRVEIDTPATVRAITLLLKHRENIDKHWKTESRSLFQFMSTKNLKGRPKFRIPAISLELRSFCGFIKHPPFWMDDLRKQSVNTDYLRTGDLRRAQSLLGHAKAGTTLSYLNGTALRRTNEAIIKDFGDILSTAYLYSSGRLIVNPAATDRKSKLTKSLLLFPSSTLHVEDGNSIADKWLASAGQLSFSIGDEEIEFCIYQREYYKKHCAKLVYENPKRFNHHHLPRILFCEALYRFIASSPLASKLNKSKANQ